MINMSVAQIIGLLAQVSVIATVFALGLRATWQDITHLLGRPGLLLRSILATYLLTPILALLLVQVVPAPKSVSVAVLLMAISTGAPMLPKKLLKFGGKAPYIYRMAVVMALLAIVTLPISRSLLAAYFGRDASIAPGPVALLLSKMFLGPLFAGVVVRHFAPRLAELAGEPIISLAGLVLLGIVLLLVVTNYTAILGVGLPGLVIIVLMTAVALAVGHILGGPDPTDRTALAVTCASRFPGLALLVATLNFPNAKPLPVIVAYLLISSLAMIPYLVWRQKTQRPPSAG